MRQSLRRARRRDREGETVLKPYTAPFRYDKAGAIIWDAKGHHVLDVRGWGHLTGGGGLALPTEEAEKIQDEFGERVVAALNNGDGGDGEKAFACSCCLVDPAVQREHDLTRLGGYIRVIGNFKVSLCMPCARRHRLGTGIMPVCECEGAIGPHRREVRP